MEMKTTKVMMMTLMMVTLIAWKLVQTMMETLIVILTKLITFLLVLSILFTLLYTIYCIYIITFHEKKFSAVFYNKSANFLYCSFDDILDVSKFIFSWIIIINEVGMQFWWNFNSASILLRHNYTPDFKSIS